MGIKAGFQVSRHMVDRGRGGGACVYGYGGDGLHAEEGHGGFAGVR